MIKFKKFYAENKRQLKNKVISNSKPCPIPIEISIPNSTDDLEEIPSEENQSLDMDYSFNRVQPEEKKRLNNNYIINNKKPKDECVVSSFNHKSLRVMGAHVKTTHQEDFSHNNDINNNNNNNNSDIDQILNVEKESNLANDSENTATYYPNNANIYPSKEKGLPDGNPKHYMSLRLPSVLPDFQTKKGKHTLEKFTLCLNLYVILV